MTGGPVLAFIARRMAALVLLLVLISFLVFTLLYLAPGSAEQALLGTRPSSPELLASLRAQHNLDEPFLAQYALWLGNAVQLDFGESIRTGRTVLETIGARLPVTLFLGIYSFVIALVLGVPLGILAAVRRRSAVDRAVVALTVVGVSTPAFVSGVFLLYVFAVALGWLPSFGAGEGFLDRLWHLALPAAAMALIAMALLIRLTRTAMIGALEQDYVAFALARGVPMREVIVRFALRNALVPIVTAAGLMLNVVLTGTVLVEATFALPGLGSLLVEAVQNKDVPMLQGVAIVFAAITIFVNLLVDLAYLVVDPRIRFGRSAA